MSGVPDAKAESCFGMGRLGKIRSSAESTEHPGVGFRV